MILKIELGDSSNDGHGRSEIIYFESNLTNAEITKAYKKSLKTTSIDFDSLFGDYEESDIPEDIRIKLIEFNIIDKDEDNCYDTESAVDLLLKFVKLSRPDFVYKLTEDKVQCINVGFSGYGLFSP